MCLAIPMQIRTIDGYTACAYAKGIEREISLFLLQDDHVAPGDFVLVHVGYAIRKIGATDAAAAWNLFDEMRVLR